MISESPAVANLQEEDGQHNSSPFRQKVVTKELHERGSTTLTVQRHGCLVVIVVVATVVMHVAMDTRAHRAWVTATPGHIVMGSGANKQCFH